MGAISKLGWGLFWFLSILGGIIAFRFVPGGFLNGFLPGLDNGFWPALYDGVYIGIRDDFEHVFYHVADRLTPLMVHILLGAVPIFFIPFQLWRSFRTKHPRLHRWMGRAAVVAIVLSAWGAVNLAVAMEIPVWGRAGFVTGTILWVAAAAWGLWCALKRDFRAHQDWMVVAAALTFGAVMIRLEFPVWRLRFPFEIAYSYATWSSWVLNLAAVGLWRTAHGRRITGPRRRVSRPL